MSAYWFVTLVMRRSRNHCLAVGYILPTNRAVWRRKCASSSETLKEKAYHEFTEFLIILLLTGGPLIRAVCEGVGYECDRVTCKLVPGSRIPHTSPQHADVCVTRDNEGLTSCLQSPVTCGSARGSRASLESRLLGCGRRRQVSTGKAKENAQRVHLRLLGFSNFDAAGSGNWYGS